MDFRGYNEQNGQSLVTAIILCYNQARFAIESLESVRSQTYNNIQLIIIDDCSSDNSVELIRQWIKQNNILCTFIAHEENRGISKTLNEALLYAKGKYIALLASDDIWLPEKICNQTEIMEKLDSNVGVIYSDVVLINENGSTYKESYMEWHKELCNLKKIPEGEVFRNLLASNFAVPSTTLVRKECYEKAGLYDENLPFEDWDMWLRISQHYKFAFLPFITTKYRYFDNSYYRRLVTTSKCDYFAALITMFVKCFCYNKIDKHDRRMLKDNIKRYADCLYRVNCVKRNDYLLIALCRTREVGSFFIYACSLLGLKYFLYSRSRKILGWLKKCFIVKKTIYLV